MFWFNKKEKLKQVKKVKEHKCKFKRIKAIPEKYGQYNDDGKFIPTETKFIIIEKCECGKLKHYLKDKYGTKLDLDYDWVRHGGYLKDLEGIK